VSSSSLVSKGAVPLFPVVTQIQEERRPSASRKKFAWISTIALAVQRFHYTISVRMQGFCPDLNALCRHAHSRARPRLSLSLSKTGPFLANERWYWSPAETAKWQCRSSAEARWRSCAKNSVANGSSRCALSPPTFKYPSHHVRISHCS
jgi:hypothetical protein